MGWLLIVVYSVLRHPIYFIQALIDSRRARAQLREIEQNREAMEHLYAIDPGTWDWFDRKDSK